MFTKHTSLLQQKKFRNNGFRGGGVILQFLVEKKNFPGIFQV